MKKMIRIRNAGWIVSAAALIALLAVANAKGMITAALCMLAVSAIGLCAPDMRQYLTKKSRGMSLLALLITALSGVNFYVMWQPSSLVAGIAQRLGMTKNAFLAFAAVLGAAAAYYAVRCVIGACDTIGRRLREDAEKNTTLYDAGYRTGKKEYVFLLVIAAAVIMICSKSSPIYPFNDWVDSNCFFTVGKSMLHGKVLYRDIYEQKGFYLYVLHALAYLISPTTFFGVYLLEIAAAFAFLVLAYKIAQLYVSDANVLYAVPVVAAIVYGAQAFCHGDSAEELCLPLLTYALWVGLKAIRHGALPERKEYFLIGVTSGIVLWIKYTMLGFYLGWYAVFAYVMLSQHQWERLLSSLKWIAVGVLAASLPVLFYFAGNQALKDLWQAYFFNNMFLYSDSAKVAREYGALGNIVNGAWLAVIRDGLLSILLAVTILWYGVARGKKDAALLIACMASTLIVFIGDTSQIYYALVFCVFAAAALPAAYDMCRLSNNNKRFWMCGGGYSFLWC